MKYIQMKRKGKETNLKSDWFCHLCQKIEGFRQFLHYLRVEVRYNVYINLL